MRLADGEHEVVVALPTGRFLMQFTLEPNVTPSIMVPPQPVLPARVSTRIERQDGTVIVEPTPKEYVSFSVADRDAFRPLRLVVNISKTNQCQIYMNIASGF
jgi:hypothetical protein